MNRIMKGAAVLFCLLCAAWYFHETVVTVVPSLGDHSDFTPYHEAARNILTGKTPFVTLGYIYPPLLAYLLTPLALMSYLKARWIWFLISQGCLLAAAALMWRATKRDWIGACSIAFVWASGDAAPESLGLGQIGPLLTLLLALAYTQREWRQTAAVAFGVALKLIPGVLGIVFLVRREWRAFGMLAAASLVLLALPWSLVVCCLSGPKTPAGTDTWTGTPAILSWSLPSVVLRIVDSPPPEGPLPADWEYGNDLPNLHLAASLRWLSIGVSLLTLLSGISVLAVASKGGLSAVQTPFAMAALISLSLAASPVCWTHYQVMQYPGMALLLGHAWRSRRWGLLGSAVVLGALLYPMPVQILRYLAMRDGGWKLISHEALYGWTSVTALACLSVFGVLVREAKLQRSA
jgi:hypothetical protein